MGNKAIFLDRDGTINIDKGYVYKPEDLKFLPGAINGLRKLQEEYKLIIITNQSGIGRGYYSKDDYFNFRDYMHKKLRKHGISITAEYFCPHNPEDNCNCRKPKTGMLEQAANGFDLNLKECWMIGDSSKDIQAGKNAGCKTIRVLTGEENQIDYADFVARDLTEAAAYIFTYTLYCY